jgi:ABC-2 type transport system ATP-binding protein
MSEMEMTAEHLIVIGRGKIISDTSMAEFIAAAGAAGVRVSSPRIVDLQQSLRSNQAEFEVTDTNTLLVQSLSAAEIGELAAQNGIPLHELTPLAPSLEEAFMKLTKDSVEFHGGTNV